MLQISHFIPSDGIGGVETAAKRSEAVSSRIRIVFTGRPQRTDQPRMLRGAVRAWDALRECLNFGALRGARPRSSDVGVFSLWKTSLLLVAWKIFSGKPAVLFLHCDKPFHRLDAVLTGLAMVFADGVLTDSHATATSRVPLEVRMRKPVRSVSMLVESVSLKHAPDRIGGRFVFWGRFAKQKRVDRALRVFAALKQIDSSVTFTLIGPDDGELVNCRQLAITLGLAPDVAIFMGPMSREAIFHQAENATFFLHLSDFEGFGMSVAEAMQQGLIPVVTPVGEIARYCTHMENSVVLFDESSTVAQLRRLLGAPDERRRLSESARRTWEGVPPYTEDFLSKIEEIYRVSRAPR